MTGVAVIGCGYWGPNMIRNFSISESCELRMVCDRDGDRLAGAAKRFPGARAVTDLDEVLAASDVDAVSICTPLRSHQEIATAALRAGKHVLLEKPMAHSAKAAEALVELAASVDRVLMVDHTFVYSSAVSTIREIIDSGRLGDMLYLDSVRVNLGLLQPDTNVIWDLAPHDISIISHLVDRPPRWVSATGAAHYGKLENLAYVTIGFDDSLLAHLHVNWLAPVKVRRTLIGGSTRMIVYDDLEPSEKVRVYDKGIVMRHGQLPRNQVLVDYRVGDMHAPYIENTEPLQGVTRAFLDAIQSGVRPLTDGEAGLEVVRLLEAADASVRKGGERVNL